MPATEIAVSSAGKVGDKEMLIPTGQQGAVLPHVQDWVTGKLKAKVSVKDISATVLVKGIKQWAVFEEKSGPKKFGLSSKSRNPCCAPAAPAIALLDLTQLEMSKITHIELPAPGGAELKSARLAAGLSQVEAAELMGYPVQAGSRGGLQSRTWQALESAQDERNMPGPVFALFLLLTHQHPVFSLTPKVDGLRPTEDQAT